MYQLKNKEFLLTRIYLLVFPFLLFAFYKY